MNFFLHKLINKRIYLMIIFFTVLFTGILTGLIQYNYCCNEIILFFQTLFFINKEQTHYQIYLFQNIIYIFFNTYLSSSYLGFLGISFLLFLKGIQFSFSIYNLLSVNMTPILLVFIVFQIIFEFLLVIFCFLPNIRLSFQTFIITFLMKDNFNGKSITNYNLNNTIIVIIIFVISLLVRIYLLDII